MFHRPLVPVLFALTGGIVAGHLWLPPAPREGPLFALGLLLCLGLLLPVLRVPLPRRATLPVLLFLFFTTGMMLDLLSHRASVLLPLAERGQEVTVEGTVLAPARILRDTSRLEVRADRITWEGREAETGEALLVTVYSHSRKFAPGERLLFPASLRPFRNFNNAGRYDHETAMAIKGIFCAASVSDGRRIVPMGKGREGSSLDLLEAGRGPLRKLFEARLFPQQQALFRALILGETQSIDQELRDLFVTTGLGHVLAVSGLHVGLVAWVVFTLFHRLLSLSYRLTLAGDLRKAAALMTFVPVVGYALLAGFHVSCQRATVMVLAYLLSIVLEREKEVWSTLSLSALVVLALDPHALFSLSFHLSFGAVIGLLWLTPRISGWLGPLIDDRLGKETPTGRLAAYLIGPLGATLSATLFLLPLIAYYFHRLSLVSLPANLMVLPILGLWVLPLGLLGSAMLVFSSLPAEGILWMASWGLDLMILIIQFWAKIPWAEVWVVTPSILEMGLYYGLWTCLLFWNKGRWFRIGLVALVLVLAGDLAYWLHRTCFHPSLRVTFLDVGQGSATLIQFPGRERMLIDGGGGMQVDFDMGKMVIAPTLLALKIRRIDYLVLSHPDSDHMGGLPFIASHFNPREFWHNGATAEGETYAGLMKIVRERGVIERSPSDLKEARDLSGVRVERLHPAADGDLIGPSGRPLKGNDRSLVLKLTHQGISFLFPGDLEKEGEERVVTRIGGLLESDVLLAPHHGSGRSCSLPFLESVKPRFCIISARTSNPPRFPHPETLRRLERTGCRILQVEQTGAITFSTDGGGVEIRSFLAGSLRP